MWIVASSVVELCLWPVLDLCSMNFSLYNGKFKMLTLKAILVQVRVDAYLNIQVVQQHRMFLRFTFGVKAYQYRVLPFCLALAPRTFTKCMDAALALLRLLAIRVLNYLDDWLSLAHFRELLILHIDILLHHLRSLGIRLKNAQKSVFTPSQQTIFLGVKLNSVLM